MINKINKKAQHEIMGFVLIIIIVSIIGLIFLGFMVGKGEPVIQESIQISNLLISSMYYTSDCAINYVPNYKDGQDLIKECYSNSISVCLNSKNVCESLDSTMRKLIGESLKVGEDSPNKAYELIIYYKDLEGELPNEEILILEEGIFSNCSSQTGGRHFIPAGDVGGGTINVELSVCRG